jgi:hypothetical protein
MKLIIQIPCYNEAVTLATALEVNRCGIDHLVSFSQNRGLARGFYGGLPESR